MNSLSFRERAVIAIVTDPTIDFATEPGSDVPKYAEAIALADQLAAECCEKWGHANEPCPAVPCKRCGAK